MGFRFRKSIRIGGGFRVNLSKSGVSYSWGVKGYTVTKKADGRIRQTVSIPGTGLSYSTESGRRSHNPPAATPSVSIPYNAYDLQEVTSAGVEYIGSSVYKEISKRIKLTRASRWITFFIAAPLLGPLAVPLPFLAAYLLPRLFFQTKIHYDFEGSEQIAWDRLHLAWSGIAKSEKLEQITVTAKNQRARLSANIENSVSTVPVKAVGKLPWYLKTNITPVVLKCKEFTLAILPDRLFLFNGRKVSAIDYADIDIKVDGIGYLESGAVPAESEIIEYRWAYSNKDGSPDRRFSGNKQYPVVKYARIQMTTSSGMDVRFICSNIPAAELLQEITAK